MPEHSELIGALLHPPQPLTFTGAVELYTPNAPGVLAVKTDVTPYALYLTTGVTAGAVALIGAGGVPAPGGDYDAATEAWIAASSGTYSTPELEALDDLVLYCKGVTIAAGGSLWDASSLLAITAVDNATDAQLNLKTALSTLTYVGSPTFTARQGIQLNGSNQMIGSGQVPSAISAAPEGFVGAYLRQNKDGADDFTYIAYGQDADSRVVDLSIQGGLVSSIHGGGNRFLTQGGNEQGCNSGSLTTTDRIAAFNQTSAITARSTPTAACETQVYYGAANIDGASGGDWNSNQYAALWQGWGQGLTEAELLGLHAAIETCLDVFGAGVIS